MKKIVKPLSSTAFICLLCFLVLFSCRKDNKTSDNINQEDESLTHGLSRIIGSELLRIRADVENPDYEIAITDNPNFGLYSPNSDVYMSGKTAPSDNITVRLNNTTYSPASDGQWLQKAPSLANYFGINVEVLIKSGSNTLLKDTIFVTSGHITSRLATTTCCGLLSRTGKTLSWTPDASTQSLGKIALNYRLFATDGSVVEQDVLLLEDNGSYSLDNILDNTLAKKITFDLVSGNAIATMCNSKKILFYIYTSDHHMYDIEP